LTTSIIVLFVGKWLNRRFDALRRYNISESVSGGLLVSIVLAAVYFVFRVEVQFDLALRPFLLVYFFTAVGINTRLNDLLAARRSLVALLMATIAYMALQHLISVWVASGLGSSGGKALLVVTVALTGGNEAVMAWAPTFENDFGIANALEIGIASAAFGLILGSLTGGPIAHYLIKRHGLRHETVEVVDGGLGGEDAERNVDPYVFLQSILAIHICVIVGFALNEFLADVGFAVPLPVACFLVAIFLTNLVPSILPKTSWPSRSLAMFLIAELSLGILFGMSLISAQLWVIAHLPAQYLTIVLVQVAATIAVTIFFIFRILGRNHDAAVICSGFAGFALGSTATAMANMKAVARHAGTSHLGFVIVPLVAVICIAFVNGFLIERFLYEF
jgi:ESS family glutamate:Na+ symporter